MWAERLTGRRKRLGYAASDGDAGKNGRRPSGQLHPPRTPRRSSRRERLTQRFNYPTTSMASSFTIFYCGNHDCVAGQMGVSAPSLALHCGGCDVTGDCDFVRIACRDAPAPLTWTHRTTPSVFCDRRMVDSTDLQQQLRREIARLRREIARVSEEQPRGSYLHRGSGLHPVERRGA